MNKDKEGLLIGIFCIGIGCLGTLAFINVQTLIQGILFFIFWAATVVPFVYVISFWEPKKYERSEQKKETIR